MQENIKFTILSAGHPPTVFKSFNYLITQLLNAFLMFTYLVIGPSNNLRYCLLQPSLYIYREIHPVYKQKSLGCFLYTSFINNVIQWWIVTSKHYNNITCYIQNVTIHLLCSIVNGWKHFIPTSHYQHRV